LGVVYAIGAFLLFRITLEPLVERLTGVPRELSRFDFLKNNLPALLKFLAIIWLMAAFFEELYFRGFLIPSIAGIFNRSRPGWILAVVISTLFFAISHSYQSITGVIYTGLAALYLSSIYFSDTEGICGFR
jgi:CAAX protease family protein